MKRIIYVLAFVLLAGSMMLSACAPATNTPVPPTATSAPVANTPVPPTATSAPASGEVVLPEVNPAQYSGTIIAAGSSTVYPLAERMAERFQDEGFAG
ncbi:MAG: PstS family phosphate ABC transporter substrate-binding protein, partial [Anaerolineae bacterium]